MAPPTRRSGFQTRCHHLQGISVNYLLHSRICDDSLRLTVASVARASVKPSPAGTVNPLMLTAVQLAAAATSERELIVAVQAASTEATKTRTGKESKASMSSKPFSLRGPVRLRRIFPHCKRRDYKRSQGFLRY